MEKMQALAIEKQIGIRGSLADQVSFALDEKEHLFAIIKIPSTQFPIPVNEALNQWMIALFDDLNSLRQQGIKLSESEQLLVALIEELSEHIDVDPVCFINGNEPYVWPDVWDLPQSQATLASLSVADNVNRQKRSWPMGESDKERILISVACLVYKLWGSCKEVLGPYIHPKLKNVLNHMHQNHMDKYVAPECFLIMNESIS